MSKSPAARQRARARKRIPDFTDDDYYDLYLRQERACAYCGQRLSLDDATVDHAVPLSRGGNNTIQNVYLVCLSDNQAKGSRTVEEYLGYPEARRLGRKFHSHEPYEAILYRRVEAMLLHEFMCGDEQTRAHARYALALMLVAARHSDPETLLAEGDAMVAKARADRERIDRQGAERRAVRRREHQRREQAIADATAAVVTALGGTSNTQGDEEHHAA